MNTNGQSAPAARTEGLAIQELPEEVVVYDLESHQVHCLNNTAAAIWRACDGRRTIDEIADLVSVELSAPVGVETVWLGVYRLQKLNLLHEEEAALSEADRVSRREFLRKAIKVAAIGVVVPVIASISAPTAARAATCRQYGQPCGTGANCCPGLVCASGKCV